MIHAVLGTGPCSADALKESLKDALSPGDELVLPWVWPIPESLETVYGYVLDNEIPFVLTYSDGASKPPTRHFREADFGVVQKTRDPITSCLQQCDGTVLYLWDDNEELLCKIFDDFPSMTVLELSNGLSPIVVYSWDEGEHVAPQVDEEEEEKIEPLSRDELEIMAASAVKRYGERIGCSATTKSGIIEELFGEATAAPPTLVKTIYLYSDGTWTEA